MAKIRTVADREKLKPRSAPYFLAIARGCALGIRKWSATSEGTWIARWRDPATGKQHHQPLGAFDDLPARARYDAALDAAREWWAHIGHGGTPSSLSVQDAGERYAASLERDGRHDAAFDVRRRFRQYVNDTALARIPLSQLAPHQVEEWRHQLQDTLTPTGTRRTAATLNRDLVCLKAALNFALDKRWLTTNVWQRELRPIRGADKRRDLYLDAVQRQQLIKAARADLRPFLRALCSLPLRVGAMAALTAGDYNVRLRTITINQDKAGAGRSITLPKSTAKLFSDAAKEKLPAAPLFARYDGAAWTKDRLKGPLKDAAQAAGLPPETVAYTLRHSVITDLMVGGADPLTVAQISGTSLLMIQRHYGHLVKQAATAALEKVAT